MPKYFGLERAGIYRLVFCSLCLLFSILLLASTAIAQETTSQTDQPKKSVSSTTQRFDKFSKIVVPVYPGGTLKKLETESDLEALAYSYITLGDGSVVSLKDWVLGGLGKTDISRQLSDYESRFFLGQVARSAAGLSDDLIYRSFIDSGDPISFPPPKELPIAIQQIQWLVGQLLPGTPENWTPWGHTGGFNPRYTANGDSTFLAQESFSEKIEFHAEEFKKDAMARQLLINAGATFPND